MSDGQQVPATTSSDDEVRDRALKLVKETAEAMQQLLQTATLTILAKEVIDQLIGSLCEAAETITSGAANDEQVGVSHFKLWRQAVRFAEDGWGIVEPVKQLPVYLLLDTSGSMRGEPIASVRVGLESMLSMLRADPRAMESVHLSIIRFDRDVETLAPLTALPDFQMPALVTPDSGPTHLGMALDELCGRMDAELPADDPNLADPLLLVMTDGSPSDKMKYNEMIPLIRGRRFGRIIACAAGAKAKTEDLKPLADVVVSLDTMDGSSFSKLFEWFFHGIHDATTESVSHLPPPPAELHIAL